ncbi:BspA family leucine-rich repeat surface protein [Lactobacillus sp. ESL0681]|uniref:BspA family leucine-rich repeat surface protein n=1 Tax=Lactobacillus sp. ESL0681 TaxID=2983211 RepID=UPI0023F673FE|nr:BspA family leucine-rich repeat surface protein [Lactobacillus sp. ESL0681]WEV39619.1 BspA family leucine-rich repeat surface protein [Lactobacillus sp. ESL0681]
MKRITHFQRKAKSLLIAATILVSIGTLGFKPTSVAAAEPSTNTFATLWSGQDGECNWSYDIITRTLTISKGTNGQQLGTKPIANLVSWSSTIERIVFATPVILPINSDSKFNNLHNLISIDNFDLVDTSQTVNMSNLFSNNPKLTKLDLSKINTIKVANMTNMFAGDIKLTSLDLSQLNTEHVKKKQNMFTGSGLNKTKPNNDQTANSIIVNDHKN